MWNGTSCSKASKTKLFTIKYNAERDKRIKKFKIWKPNSLILKTKIKNKIIESTIFATSYKKKAKIKPMTFSQRHNRVYNNTYSNNNTL